MEIVENHRTEDYQANAKEFEGDLPLGKNIGLMSPPCDRRRQLDQVSVDSDLSGMSVVDGICSDSSARLNFLLGFCSAVDGFWWLDFLVVRVVISLI